MKGRMEARFRARMAHVGRVWGHRVPYGALAVLHLATLAGWMDRETAERLMGLCYVALCLRG